MRVVLDSNLIISALINGAGIPAGVLEAWRRGRFALVLSEEQLEELRRVTRYERLRREYPDFCVLSHTLPKEREYGDQERDIGRVTEG